MERVGSRLAPVKGAGKVKAEGRDLQQRSHANHRTLNGLRPPHARSVRRLPPVFQTPVDKLAARDAGAARPLAAPRAGRSFLCLNTLEALCRFAGALDPLLVAPDARALEERWVAADLDTFAWRTLHLARAAESAGVARTLAQVDRRLLALLRRARALGDPHLVTFRIPELERWQHATAAALTGVRWGLAGLHTVATDTRAPLARRYYALLGLAERHPRGTWPLFERYLRSPGAHHAFVAVSVEATRYYEGRAGYLIELFERVREDELLRRFLGPKILASLTVLGDPRSLPLFESLLVGGHTDPDRDRCEVTRALVAVRKLTGRIAPSAKFADPDDPEVRRAVEAAERHFDAERDRLVPVTVI